MLDYGLILVFRFASASASDVQVCINNALLKVFAKRKEQFIENFTFALSNNPNHRL